MQLLEVVDRVSKDLSLGNHLRLVQELDGLVYVYDAQAWPNKATELLRLWRPQVSVSVVAMSASLTGLVVIVSEAQLNGIYRWRMLLALLALAAACALALHAHGPALHTCLLQAA